MCEDTTNLTEKTMPSEKGSSESTSSSSASPIGFCEVEEEKEEKSERDEKKEMVCVLSSFSLSLALRTSQSDHLIHLLQFQGDVSKARHELFESLTTLICKRQRERGRII